ncbi:MAG: hypothetical protein KAT58_00930 [candidate division Zixibacteria bacterium]|nr:hypothetical protein [candidate division Zixibacteria bacterium]
MICLFVVEQTQVMQMDKQRRLANSVQRSNHDILGLTAEFWSQRCCQPICTDDAREIIDNITGFFDILARWDREAESDA